METGEQLVGLILSFQHVDAGVWTQVICQASLLHWGISTDQSSYNWSYDLASHYLFSLQPSTFSLKLCTSVLMNYFSQVFGSTHHVILKTPFTNFFKWKLWLKLVRPSTIQILQVPLFMDFLHGSIIFHIKKVDTCVTCGLQSSFVKHSPLFLNAFKAFE